MSNQLPPQLGSDSNHGQKPGQEPMLTSPPAGSAAKGLEDNRDGYDVRCSYVSFLLTLFKKKRLIFANRISSYSSVKPSLLLTSASKIEPMKALDSRFTERSKATSGVTVAISSTTGLVPLERYCCFGNFVEALTKFPCSIHLCLCSRTRMRVHVGLGTIASCESIWPDRNSETGSVWIHFSRSCRSLRNDNE